jgi:hypothetical protein
VSYGPGFTAVIFAASVAPKRSFAVPELDVAKAPIPAIRGTAIKPPELRQPTL